MWAFGTFHTVPKFFSLSPSRFLGRRDEKLGGINRTAVQGKSVKALTCAWKALQGTILNALSTIDARAQSVKPGFLLLFFSPLSNPSTYILLACTLHTTWHVENQKWNCDTVWEGRKKCLTLSVPASTNAFLEKKTYKGTVQRYMIHHTFDLHSQAFTHFFLQYFTTIRKGSRRLSLF